MNKEEKMSVSTIYILDKLEEQFLTEQLRKGQKDIREGRFYTQKHVEEMFFE